MENDAEISSTTENTHIFDDDPLQIAVEQICTTDEQFSKCEEDKVVDCCIHLESKSLPPKRIRKATRKKLESLQCYAQFYECVECPQTFSRLSQLKAHSKCHVATIKTELYKCDDCRAEATSLRSLMTHRRQCHETIMCPVCQLECNSQSNLKIHVKTHKGEKPYICKECGSSFSQSGHLSIHTRTHTGEKPYTCEICNNNFKQISHLKTHVRTHTHDKPYRCNQCPAAFTQNSSLKRHKRSHTGEKPYKCLYCDMTFVVKSNMQRHLNTHTGERPFECDLCSASFGQAIDLKRHKISHTGIKPFKCDLCDAAFSRKNNLKWHKLTHSENAGYQCSVCFAGFSSTGDLKAHMRNHAPPKPYTCDICPSSFRLIDSLNRHKLIHTGGRPLRMKSCKPDADSKFIKVKPYTCMLCSASFCEKRNLKRHMLSIHNDTAYMKNTISTDSDNVSDVNATPPSEETSISQEQVQDSKPVFTIDGSTCISSEVLTVPSPQQIVMQTIPSQDGFTHVPQFLLAGPGHTPRPARPAGQCQNHTMHILTYVEGTYSHWQSWCFCDPPNIPGTGTQIVVSSTTGNEIAAEGMTQILVTGPVQSSVQENVTQQLLMTTNTISSNSSSPQILLNTVSTSDQIATVATSTGIASLTVDSVTVAGDGNVGSGCKSDT